MDRFQGISRQNCALLKQTNRTFLKIYIHVQHKNVRDSIHRKTIVAFGLNISSNNLHQEITIKFVF